MKTGFNYILSRFQDEGCIVCDADGQHPADSVDDVAEAMEHYPKAMVLGVRRFTENKDMPKANLFGNQITRFTFFLLSGMRYADTQCGLRGYPASVMAKVITCAGERFEMENTMLMDVRRLGIEIVQVGMPAVYQEEGKYTSHFNKLRDSARIYKVLFGYAALPLVSAAVSFALFMLLRSWLPSAFEWSANIAAAAGYLAGWLVLLTGISKKNRGVAVAAMIAVTLAATAIFTMLDLLIPSAPVGCWWITAPFSAAGSYILWRKLSFGPRPRNIRLDKGQRHAAEQL